MARIVEAHYPGLRRELLAEGLGRALHLARIGEEEERDRHDDQAGRIDARQGTPPVEALPAVREPFEEHGRAHARQGRAGVPDAEDPQGRPLLLLLEPQRRVRDPDREPGPREPEAEAFVQLIHAADACRISVASYVELSMVIERQLGVGRATADTAGGAPSLDTAIRRSFDAALPAGSAANVAAKSAASAASAPARGT